MPLFDPDKVEDTMLIIGDTWMNTNKKWFYFLFGSIILALPLYFGAQKLTASIISSKYNPPKLIAQAERLPLQEVDKKIIKIGDNSYSGYVRIKNPNLEWGVPKLDYQIEIRSADGTLLDSVADDTYILPALEKYIVIPRFNSNKAPTQIDVTFLTPRFVAKPKIADINIEIQRTEIIRESNNTTVFAVVRNNSPFTIKQVDLYSFIYNDKSEIVGINFTNINELLSTEIRSFQMVWPATLDGNIRAEAVRELNIYDKELLKTQGPVSPF